MECNEMVHKHAVALMKELGPQPPSEWGIFCGSNLLFTHDSRYEAKSHAKVLDKACIYKHEHTVELVYARPIWEYPYNA